MAQWLRVGLQVHWLSPHWFESQSVEIFFMIDLIKIDVYFITFQRVLDLFIYKIDTGTVAFFSNSVDLQSL